MSRAGAWRCVRVVGLGVGFAVSGCMMSYDDPATPGPMALVDAYLVAHGMATSYAESETAEPAVVDQLVKLDRRAADAIRSLAMAPSAGQASTEAAISALTTYAARQAIVAQ